MHYEIHITVLTPNIEQFKNDCSYIGVKPIVIETQNKKNEFEQQVMTSSKYEDAHYIVRLINLSKQLKSLGYKILRQKVEIKPEYNKHNLHKYYETHLRIKYPKNESNENLKRFCSHTKFHLSKNLFKVDKEFNYQLLTFRTSDMSYDQFYDYVEKSLDCLKNAYHYNYDKIEIEEAILDTNIDIDKNWLN